MVEKGKTVKFEYTLKVEGQVIDTSVGKEPLEYVHGEGRIISGLEKQMEGLKVGDERTIAVPAQEAYGLQDPQAIQEVQRSMFPADADIRTGMMISLQAQDGRQLPAVIQEVKDDKVVLDFNHPLAGKDLVFDVKIIDIQ